MTAAKANYENYQGFLTERGIRYRDTSLNKMVKTEDVPKEIRERLELELQMQVAPPAPADLMDEEAPELNTPIEGADTLSQDDFIPFGPGEPVPTPPFSLGEPTGLAVNAGLDVMPTEFSIFDASIDDLAMALYERFGFYTVFLKKEPQDGDVNPMTGVPMTRYDRGVAYTAYNRMVMQGAIKDTADLEMQKLDTDNGRAVSEQYQSDPASFNRHRDNSSFAYRTSVEGANNHPDGRPDSNMKSTRHPEEEEMIAEPPLVAPPIIRPNW